MRPVPDRDPLHAVTWAVWAVSAAACVELAPNPVYVVVVGAVAFAVASVHGRDDPVARSSFPLLLAVAGAFGLLRVVLTALTTHGGGDPVFTTPSARLPALLGGFRVGGPVEAEVVLQAASEALVVVGVMAVFGAFNAVVSSAGLVRSLPRAFHEVGLVVAVAVAFVPATIATVQRVREADRARTGGRVVRRGRLVRQLVPVVEAGLERALALAESMDARGFAGGASTRGERRAAWLVLAGLVALGGSFVALVAREQAAAVVLGVAGAAGVVGAVGAGSRAVNRVRYRPRRPQAVDAAVTAAVLAAPLALVAAHLAGEPTLRWSASPLAAPGVNPLVVAALAVLAVPALAGRSPAPAGRRRPSPAASPSSP